jgi:hypothetical protein
MTSAVHLRPKPGRDRISWGCLGSLPLLQCLMYLQVAHI